MPSVEILAVGSELLGAERVDTNSLWLTAQLDELGFEVTAKAVIGDRRPRLVAALREALAHADVVICTGGLGPTEDDLTRDAAAEAVGLPLEHREEIWQELQDKFARMGRSIPQNNRRQAQRLSGAETLPNPRGTAPGQYWRGQDKTLILLPGPPRELKPMFSEHVSPRLSGLGALRQRRLLKVIGLGESAMEERISHLYPLFPEVAVTTLFTPLDLEIHLSSGASQAGQLEFLQAAILEALREHVYSQIGQSLAEVVGELLQQRGLTLATAESLTGGLLAERITAIPGSSRYFLGSWVTYSETLKHRELGVPLDMLERHSAVSAPVAEAMAEGARSRSGADLALALTGYAGPDGGTDDNPVGTVYLGLATAAGAQSQRLVFPGDREMVRSRAAQTALDWLRRELHRGDRPD